MTALPPCEYRGRMFSEQRCACRHPSNTGRKMKSRPVPTGLCLRCPIVSGAAESAPAADLQAQTYGPGSKLSALFTDLGIPRCCQCAHLAGRMDTWGVSGCRARVDDIVSEIEPQARAWIKQGWLRRVTPGAVLRTFLRSYVHEAIEKAEKAS